MHLSRVIAALALGCVLANAPSARAADSFTLDPVHSSVIFRIKHNNVAWFYGRFNDVSGTVVFDDADPTKNSVEITIKTDSVDTNNEKRDTHLKSPDFFDAAQFPTLTFKSTRVVAKGPNLFAVTGDLTVHGVKKEVTVDVERVGTGKDSWGNLRTGAETVFTVDRREFGISFMPDGLGDQVKIFVSLEAIKK